MAISLEESLAVCGNSNHLRGFLACYEAKIEENSESEKRLPDAPHYFAWIHFASEQVFYRIKEMIYLIEQDEKAFDRPYKSLLNYLILKHDLSSEQQDVILLFAKIRHLLVHKGFPNPHITPFQNKREIAKGHFFDTSEVKELVHLLCSPKFYPSLRKKFLLAMEAISSLEGEVDKNFGFLRITKKKC